MADAPALAAARRSAGHFVTVSVDKSSAGDFWSRPHGADGSSAEATDRDRLHHDRRHDPTHASARS